VNREWTRVLAAAALAAACTYTVSAQIDVSGNWRTLPRNQDGSGMIGDIAGVPVSEAGRARAESWSPDEFDMAEWICRPHAFDYSLEGPLSALRMWAEVDVPTQEVVAYRGHLNMMGQETTIWMDGRPHPPANAPHSWSGFSTGVWEGDTLVVTTTHLKEAYIRRWGLMRSDRSVVRTRWRRLGDFLQATSILYDPVYLTEPYIRTTMMWAFDPAMPLAPYPCEEATETAVPRGTVTHFLPGQNPLPSWGKDIADDFDTPFEARTGGPESMYPEYIAKMKAMPKPSKQAPPNSTERGR
jgi:hypothetical protein